MRSLNDIDWLGLRNGREFYPSPTHWEDEVILFLLVDRFSDGRETDFRDNTGNLVTTGTTPVYQPKDNGNAVEREADASAWRNAGGTWVGGTLKGVQSKLGYLQRLGITTVWVSPILKQVTADASYHGYGVQNFLAIDPHFGTADDLRDLVANAHALGIRILLDVVLNHTGDVFRYEQQNPGWTGETYAVQGYRDAAGNPTLPFPALTTATAQPVDTDAAIWPLEFQDSDRFTRQGHINNFDSYPEYVDGDFFGLKDLHHGRRILVNGEDQIDEYAVAPTLPFLCEVYEYWMALADIDGFRLDTVKHMDPGATRYFVSVIHEFAEVLGKDNFVVIGEITGGREFAFDLLEKTGLDAALGIADERIRMLNFIKGEGDPAEFFDLFRNSLLVGKDSHTWFRDKVVTSLDDHDHVDQGDHKHRFAAGGYGAMTLAAMAVNATTLGIPCFYYGTEQLFDGEGSGDGADRYIREAMFGGSFGAFRSRGVHFFDETGRTFLEIGKVLQVRRDQLALRRGRQYLRPISGDGVHFGLPQPSGGTRMRSIVAWSRILDTTELLCAINTDDEDATEAFVTIDNGLHSGGSHMGCLYSSAAEEIGGKVTIEGRNGKSIRLRVPPAGFVIYG